jgi:ribosomal protein L16/L10AE
VSSSKNKFLNKNKKCILNKRLSYSKKSLIFGNFGFFPLSPIKMSNKLFETLKLICSRNIKPGKYWFRVSPSFAVTKKSAGVRMGKGRGTLKFKEGRVQAGQVFLELRTPKGSNVSAIYDKIKSKMSVHIQVCLKRGI